MRKNLQMNKKILIVGFGSIGKRHLKLCQKHGYNDFIILVHNRKKINQISKEYKVFCTDELNLAISMKPKFAIVCNPTNQHVKVTISLLNNKIPVLMEKPITDDLQELEIFTSEIEKHKCPIMVGFQFRHHPHFIRLKETIKSGELGYPISLAGFVGQYLPDWRPERDYSETSSAQKSLGGGVILDLSHEIDIAIQVLGPPRSIFSFGGKYSELKIDTEDTATITLKHDSGISSINLNYHERKYTWSTTVTCSKGSIIWDYGQNKLSVTNEKGLVKILDDLPEITRDDLFSNQLNKFIDMIDKCETSDVDLLDSINSTKACLLAKESMKKQEPLNFN